MTTAETLTDNTPVDPDDELLVAYLDGELSRQDQAALEDRLMTDDSLRSRLQQLQTGPFETFGDNRFVQIGADRSLRHLVDMQRNYFRALS